MSIDSIQKPYIDNINKLIFIHIPKTGGISICHALGMQGCYHEDAMYFITNHKNEWESYRKIAVIRDPIKRFISGFVHLHEGTTLAASQEEYLLENINEFVIKNKEQITKTIMFRPQIEYLLNADGELLDIDYLIPFPFLEIGFNLAMLDCGIKNIQLKCFNKTRNKPILREETKEILMHIYATDINLYRVTINLFFERNHNV